MDTLADMVSVVDEILVEPQLVESKVLALGPTMDSLH
jgi:hypothetical protein